MILLVVGLVGFHYMGISLKDIPDYVNISNQVKELNGKIDYDRSTRTFDVAGEGYNWSIGKKDKGINLDAEVDLDNENAVKSVGMMLSMADNMYNLVGKQDLSVEGVTSKVEGSIGDILNNSKDSSGIVDEMKKQGNKVTLGSLVIEVKGNKLYVRTE